MPENKERILTESLVWWKYPPMPNQSDEDIEWGFLQFFNDGKCKFVDQRPTDEEIRDRKTCLIRPHLE